MVPQLEGTLQMYKAAAFLDIEAGLLNATKKTISPAFTNVPHTQLPFLSLRHLSSSQAGGLLTVESARPILSYLSNRWYRSFVRMPPFLVRQSNSDLETQNEIPGALVFQLKY